MTNPLHDLSVPVVQAPMAGGPSTSALAVAVAEAGGLGMLAAGYKSASAMAEEIREVAARTDHFGVNLFVPERDPSDPEQLEAYARALAPAPQHQLADRPGRADHRQAHVHGTTSGGGRINCHFADGTRRDKPGFGPSAPKGRQVIAQPVRAGFRGINKKIEGCKPDTCK